MRREGTVIKSKLKLILPLLFMLIIITACSSRPLEDTYVPDEANLSINCLTLSPGSDETQVIFSWHSQDKNGMVHFREDDSVEEAEYRAESIFISDAFGYSHKAVVDDLKQDTSYYYVISNGVAKSPEYKLTTGNAADFSFFIVGDPQLTVESVGGWSNTVRKAVTAFPETSFMISCGDQVENIGIEAEYAAYLRPNELRSLPVAQTLGNHDIGDAAYSNHFNMPNESAYQENYWFTYGKALFMVLDSNITDIGQHKEFMEGAISSNPDCVWKIVVFHHSIYSEGAHHDSLYQSLQRDTWVPVFDKLDIDVVFSGHDHTYNRTHPMRGNKTNPNGIVYFALNSSSGSKYYDWLYLKRASFSAFRSQNYRPQFTKVYVTDDSLVITTHEIMVDNELCIIDSCAINKN